MSCYASPNLEIMCYMFPSEACEQNLELNKQTCPTAKTQRECARYFDTSATGDTDNPYDCKWGTEKDVQNAQKQVSDYKAKHKAGNGYAMLDTFQKWK